MKLLRIAAWTVWFMLGWIALAHAGPVALAIGAFANWLAAGGILAKLVIGVALQVGSSLLQRALAKKQAQPGINSQVQVGGNNSFSFIVGKYATAGSLDYVGTWGEIGKVPNAYITWVTTLSDLPISGLTERLFISKEACKFEGGAPVSGASPDAGGAGYPIEEYIRGTDAFLWSKFYDGSQTSADAFLLAKLGSDPDRPWEADMIGSGTSYVISTARYNRELFTQIPMGIYEVEGIPLYDPRKDTTVGGDGAHRRGQQETYEATSNPAVIIYNILCGIWHGDELIYGPGIPATRLPLSSWFAAMNECDVPVTIANPPGGGTGVTEPQFSCGYEIKVAEHEPADVIDELLKACNGQIAEIGGIYKIHVGAPGLPVMFVTDEDWIITDPQEFDPFKGLEATYNGASASYPEPASAWSMKDAPQRLFPDLEAEDDGRRLLADFQFNAVSSGFQVQRLMMSMVLDGRKMRNHRGTLPPVAFGLEPLDVVSWTSARNGYSSKLFTVTSKDEMTNVNQSVALREVDPDDYDWKPEDELPWSVGPIDPRWPAPVPMTGWSVAASAITDATGQPRRPAIDVFCAGDMDGARAVHVQVRNGEDEVVFDGESPYGDLTPVQKTFRLSGQWCLPDQLYTVRGRFLMQAGANGSWSSWLPVTTDDIRLGGDDIWPDDLIEDLIEAVGDMIDWIGSDLRELVDESRRLVASIIDLEAGAYRDRKQIRQTVNATFENAKAFALLQIDVATGPGSALAQALLAVEAELEGKADASSLLALTSIVNEQGDDISALSQALIDVNAEIEGKADASALLLLTGRVDEVEGDVTAISNAVIALQSGYGDATASANFRMTTSAGPAGYAARIGAEARTGGTGAYRSSSWFLDVPANAAQPTRFVVIAQQMAVMTNAGTVAALFDGDTTYLNNARIRDLTATNINVASLMASSAFVNNLRITDSLQLDPNVVIEGTIAANAVTSSDDSTTQNVNVPAGAGYVTTGSITIQSPSGNPIMFYSSGRYQNPSGGGSTARMRFMLNGTTVLREFESTGIGIATVPALIIMIPVSPGTHTITAQISQQGGVSPANINDTVMIAQCNKK